LQRCSSGIQTGVRNGKLYGAGDTHVKRGSRSVVIHLDHDLALSLGLTSRLCLQSARLEVNSQRKLALSASSQIVRLLIRLRTSTSTDTPRKLQPHQR